MGGPSPAMPNPTVPKDTGWIWECCQCYLGLQSPFPDATCISCSHIRCDDCKVVPTRPRGTSFPEPWPSEEHVSRTATDTANISILSAEPSSSSQSASSPSQARQFEIEPRSDGLSAPNAFIQNPKDYFDTVKLLQRRIFELGESALNGIRAEGDIHIAPLPIFPDLGSGAQQAAHIRQVISAVAQIASAIVQAEDLLLRSGFYEGYNIIVVDNERDNVLKVVAINSEWVKTLASLLEEGLSYCGELMDWSTIEAIAVDVDWLVRFILQELNLSTAISSTIRQPPWEREHLLQIYESASSTLLVLFLRIVSFVTSHAFTQELAIQTQALKKLCIQTHAVAIYLQPRHLICLHSFTKHHIWAFGTTSNSSKVLGEEKTYYLSLHLKDFSDLWGPLNIRYGRTAAGICYITVRGGLIFPTRNHDDDVKLRDDETLCHWSSWNSWVDSSPYYQDTCTSPFPATQRLLIGATCNDEGSEEKLFYSLDRCDLGCGRNSPYANWFGHFELGTKVPSWNLDQRTGQVSGGLYVNFHYGQVRKFDSGWTLKDVIILNWVEAFKEDGSHSPLALYLDYLTVLEISSCTGHSRRLSIWELQGNPDIQSWLKTIFDTRTIDAYCFLLASVPPGVSCASFWTDLLEDQKLTLKLVIKELLNILRCTGVGEDGMLQAWDVRGHHRLDGRRLPPNWRSMIKDNCECATFAVITRSCIRCTIFDSILPEHSYPRSEKPPVLSTSILITAPNPLVQSRLLPEISGDFESRMNGNPMETQNDPDLWKWRVHSLNDHSELNARFNAKRKQDIESVHKPSLEGTHLMKQIRDRQTLRMAKQQRGQRINGACTRKDRAVLEVPSEPRQLTFRKQYYEQTQLPESTNSRISNTQKPQQATHKMTIRPESKVGSNLKSCPLFNTSFPFQNGSGLEIGTLIPKFHPYSDRRITLGTLPDDYSIASDWVPHSSRESLVSKLVSWEEKTEKRLSDWTNRSKAILPWAISPIVEVEEPGLFAVEHVRGGSLTEGQKVVQMYIR